MMREDKNLNDVRELARGGRLVVYLPTGEQRLEEFFRVPVTVMQADPGNVDVFTGGGVLVRLPPHERDQVFKVALGLPLGSAENAQRHCDAAQSRRRDEAFIVAARLQRFGSPRAELQLPTDPEFLRERTDDLARAALGTDAERQGALSRLTDDVLVGWFRGYAPPMTAAQLAEWARDNLGLTLTITITLGAESARLKARWAARDPDVAALALGLLRRAEVS